MDLPACQILMKLTTGNNFVNILWAVFVPISFYKQITKPNCKHIEAGQILSSENPAYKMLIKSIPGINFINILLAYFFWA